MAQVELYDCVILHGGYKDHEVPKERITAREIQLLRGMHGDENVPDGKVKPHIDRKTGKQAFVEIHDQKTELFELARKYANSAHPMSGKKIVEKVFGTALIGFDKWLSETMELEQMEQEDSMRRRNDEANQRRVEAQKAA